MSETARSKAIQDALELAPDLELMRNNVGAIKGGRFTYGLRSKAHPTGSSDLVGILGPHGRFFCLEVKDRDGKTSKDRAAKQLAFRVMVRGHGGFAAVVHDADEAMAALSRARGGGDR